jgi:predicted Zn-dependent protease with MMP-like domain
MERMSNWETLVEIAQEIVDHTLQQLPAEVRGHAEQIPITLESAPSQGMEEEGIDADTLGLFVGESHDSIGDVLNPMPGQILLFLENIWDFVDRDLQRYREEVSVTLLHELGHYLGLDEEDLFDRGLD